ncbi:MAG: glucose-6-phosphate isomerase [Patescibacteria group bacterium]|nr:glucose-6-phosphate isomerase [Patescibacteria group bacterium]
MKIKLQTTVKSPLPSNLRDSFLDEVEKGMHPFIDTALDQDLIKKLKTLAKDYKKFKKIIVLGIGGSSLGGIALIRALYTPLKHMEKDATHFFFLDQIDPDLISHLESNIDLKNTHFIVISKSGGTIETVSLYKYFLGKIKNQKLKTEDHFTFVTNQKSGFLLEEAQKQGIKTLSVPENLSGRFSVLSNVGLLPAAIAKLDIEAIQKGAKEAFEDFKKSSSSLALTLAANQYALNKQNKSINVIFPYSYRLNRFADWYIQLMAESLGKKRAVGPTPIRAIGPTDQHSQLQLFMEGPRNKQILFLEVGKTHHEAKIPGEKYTLGDLMLAEKKGTEQALEKASVPSQTLHIPYIDAEAIGELIMTLELQIALLAKMYGVNTYNQPGVEAGKKITKGLLK